MDGKRKVNITEYKKKVLCAGYSVRDFIYLLIYPPNNLLGKWDVKVKQFAQGHTVGSGRDQI